VAESGCGGPGAEDAPMTLTARTAPAPPAAMTRRPAHDGGARRQTGREAGTRTYPRALPIVPVRARGLTVEGADGRRYLDCLSGGGTLPLGHNHPVVLEAIRTVLDSGAPLHAPDLASPVRDAFVDELLGTLPPALARHARVRFCGPGEADAVATAVTLVRAATGRTGIVRYAEGMSDAALTGVGGGRPPPKRAPPPPPPPPPPEPGPPECCWHRARRRGWSPSPTTGRAVSGG
jgi:diaminobutyrate-2-oxoglutarate transaminase